MAVKQVPKSQSGNSIRPNTFQHPNIFVDDFMYLLTPEDNTVLAFAVRRILGFNEHRETCTDNISLSQFVSGIKNKSGEYINHGCGMGVNTIRASLAHLAKYKILIPTTEKPNPIKGQEYYLQLDKNEIDLDAMQADKDRRDSIAKNRTKKATKKSLASRSYVARKTSKNQPVTSDVRQGVTSDVRQGVTSDVNTKPTETHSKTSAGATPARTPKSKTEPQPKATDSLAVVLYREVTGKYPKKVCWQIVTDHIAKVSARLGRDALKDDLLPYFVFWVGKGWNENSVDWLEYAVRGNTERQAKTAIRDTRKPLPKFVNGKMVTA